MPLTPGSTIGVYEVLSQLGAGGMGEVYRARDSKLKRDVAIKVLPGDVANDRERLARFHREAEVLASLNHPHIAHVYGIEANALVMELVEGEDLSQRIARGPIPIDEALPIAKQIAEALEAAHDAGIVHRDLKPGNIKVRGDGTVKVLDFGLAKAFASGARSGEPAADLANSPTITSPAMTLRGVILGTAAYMAPEQAKGRPIDQRSDIWAFGCVLYEMLTAKRAFEGDDVTDTLAALVLKEPDWSRLPASTPPAIRRLLHRCLAKSVNERLRSVGDAQFDIAEAMAHANDYAFTAATASHHPSRLFPSWVVATGLIAALVLVAVLGWGIGRGQRVPATTVPSAVRLSLVPADEDTIATSGNDRDLAISPDGKRIAYVGGNGTAIVVRDLERQQAVRINRAGLPHNPFFSPDGSWVGFVDGLSSIKKVPAAGGPIEIICRIMNPGVTAAWHGSTIVFAQNGRVYQVSSSGGTPEAVTPEPGAEQGALNTPTFLPGGEAVLVGVAATSTSDAGIAVVDLSTGTQKLVVALGRSPGGVNGLIARFIAPHHLVYRAARPPGGGEKFGLRVVGFDLRRMETVGTPTVVDEPIYITDFGGYPDFDIAQTGTLVYVSTDARPNARRPVWVRRDGQEDPIDLPPRAYTYPNVSPDGRQVAFDIRDQQNDSWIWDVQRHTLRRLTFDPGFNQYAVWTHDQRHVAHFLNGMIRWQPPDGSGQPEEFAIERNLLALYAFSKDDKQLVFREDFPETGHDLMVLSIEDRTIRPLVQTRSNELNADLSPDGRWLAYESDESGPPSVYVRPFPNVNDGRWQVSTSGGRTPRWSPDGKELYFLALDGAMMVARIEASAAFVSHEANRLFEHRNFVGGASSIGRTYDVSVDGTRFRMFKPAPPPHISVVLNWAQTLPGHTN